MSTLQVLGIIGDDNWLRFRRLYTPTNNGRRSDYKWLQVDVDDFLERMKRNGEL